MERSAYEDPPETPTRHRRGGGQDTYPNHPDLHSLPAWRNVWRRGRDVFLGRSIRVTLRQSYSFPGGENEWPDTSGGKTLTEGSSLFILTDQHLPYTQRGIGGESGSWETKKEAEEQNQHSPFLSPPAESGQGRQVHGENRAMEWAPKCPLALSWTGATRGTQTERSPISVSATPNLPCTQCGIGRKSSSRRDQMGAEKRA